MPFKQVEVDAEVKLSHKGVTIYHVYQDNHFDNKRDDLYTTDKGSDFYNEEELLELSGYDPKEHTKILKEAIDTNTLDKLRYC